MPRRRCLLGARKYADIARLEDLPEREIRSPTRGHHASATLNGQNNGLARKKPDGSPEDARTAADVNSGAGNCLGMRRPSRYSFSDFTAAGVLPDHDGAVSDGCTTAAVASSEPCQAVVPAGVRHPPAYLNARAARSLAAVAQIANQRRRRLSQSKAARNERRSVRRNMFRSLSALTGHCTRPTRLSPGIVTA